ncbi:hypothetical protein LMG28690_05499 [Paraburkholderia caffeinilytica]|nr:hypothetical protein LMG28690_05499 [Paraburkholderia caffeinilytica]
MHLLKGDCLFQRSYNGPKDDDWKIAASVLWEPHHKPFSRAHHSGGRHNPKGATH